MNDSQECYAAGCLFDGYPAEMMHPELVRLRRGECVSLAEILRKAGAAELVEQLRCPWRVIHALRPDPTGETGVNPIRRLHILDNLSAEGINLVYQGGNL